MHASFFAQKKNYILKNRYKCLGHYNEITCFSSLCPKYKHAGWCLLLLFIIVVSLARQQTRTVRASEAAKYTEKFAYGYCFQVKIKDVPLHQHLPNTLTNKWCDQIHHFILHRDPLAIDDGSRKNSTALESQPGGNNEVNDISVRGLPIDAGRR